VPIRLEQVFAIYKGLDKAWHVYFQDSLGFSRATNVELFRRLLEQEQDLPDGLPAGFEDFPVRQRARFIQPGRPAFSAFYHALASPSVIIPNLPKAGYPNESDLETLENFIFAEAKRSVSDLRQMAKGAPLGVVVFAKQYRVARETTYGRPQILFSHALESPEWVMKARMRRTVRPTS
jgi:hypothetical protein